MFLFAWSLVDSAIKYSRQLRITSILTRYFFSPYSHQNMIICRQIARNRYPIASVKGPVYRAPSEPNIYQEDIEILLYRTENAEIISTPQKEKIKISEWSLCCTPSNLVQITSGTKNPRISFVVRLAKTNINCINSEELSGNTEEKNEASEETVEPGDKTTKLDTSTLYCQLTDLAERIAFKRESPNEIIYEADVENFYNIVFYWSENSLFDFDGRAVVEYIYSITLPMLNNSENMKWHVQSLANVSEENSDQPKLDTLSLPGPSKSSELQQPHSLLELLYLRDLRGDFRIKTRGRMLNKSGSKYKSDMALQNSHSGEFHRSLTRNSWSLANKLDGAFYDNATLIRSNSPVMVRSTNSSIRYRSCSPMSYDYKRSERAKKLLKDFNIVEDVLTNSIHFKTLPDWFTSPYFKRLYEPRFHSITYSSMDNGLDKIQLLNSYKEDTTNCMLDKQSVDFTNHTPKVGLIRDVASMDLPTEKSSPLTEKSLTSSISSKSSKTESIPVVQINERPIPIHKLDNFNKRFSIDFGSDEKKSKYQEYSRRRSVSPMLVSAMTNLARKDYIDRHSNGSISDGTKRIFSHDSFSKKSKRFHSAPRAISNDTNTIRNFSNSALQKPPTIFIFAADDSRLFNRIFSCLNKILPPNLYTITSLSLNSFLKHPWIEDKPICLFLANTSLLNDVAWLRLQAYFVTGGKIIFLCQNSLLANLTHCDSRKMQTNLLKNAFGSRSVHSSLGKDFERFLKKGLKSLAKHKQMYEKFYAKDLVGGGSYSAILQKKIDQPLLLYMENSEQKGSALFSDATTDQLLAEGGALLIEGAISRLGIPVNKENNNIKFSHGYLIATQDRILWNMKGISYGEYIGEKPTLYLQPTVVLNGGFDKLPDAHSDLLPIEVRRKGEGLPINSFNSDKYIELLKTKSLGHILLYVPVCESTMNISKSFSHIQPENGLLIVAACQTKGKGRGGNQWLSPLGCALFTLNLNINMDSLLGQNATFVQHLMAVAIVEAVHFLVGDNEFPLKIKWPNDIYFNHQYKLGGILVNASVKSDQLICCIGVGLNVSNSKPTICINDMLTDNTPKLEIESVIAEIMNKFEDYVNLFEQGQFNEFLQKYYKYWLHSNQQITIDSDGKKENVVIQGLDLHGFLKVKNLQNGEIFTVQDNGNTFDMMKGLIRPKANK